MGKLSKLDEKVVGRRFGKLVVKSLCRVNANNVRSYYCKCDCGSEDFIARGTRLLNGETQHCSKWDCFHPNPNKRKITDLSGKSFSRLLVLGLAKKSPVKWLCRCSCGKTRVVSANNLLNGHTSSCGCLKRDVVRKPRGISAFYALKRRYIDGARSRNLQYNLTDDELKTLFGGNCFYCGIEPKQKMEHPDFNGDFIYNGIDRVDNKRGYIRGNVVSCCKKCNRMKSDMDSKEFINHINRILEVSNGQKTPETTV